MNKLVLATAIRSAVSAMHKRLRKQAGSAEQFSMTELETIGLLMRQPALRPSELAILTRIKTQSMSQVLNKLEENDIIKRTPSKEDKRKVFISLTSSGRKLVEKTRIDRDEWLKKSIENLLTEKEKVLLERAIPVLNKLIENKQ